MSNKKTPNAFTTLKHVQTNCNIHRTAKAVLLVLALHATGPTGEGSYPGKPAIARESGLSQRTVQRWLGWLRENGYIRLGDQSLVAHLPADKRPVVYDVVLTKRFSDEHGETA